MRRGADGPSLAVIFTSKDGRRRSRAIRHRPIVVGDRLLCDRHVQGFKGERIVGGRDRRGKRAGNHVVGTNEEVTGSISVDRDRAIRSLIRPADVPFGFGTESYALIQAEIAVGEDKIHGITGEDSSDCKFIALINIVAAVYEARAVCRTVSIGVESSPSVAERTIRHVVRDCGSNRQGRLGDRKGRGRIGNGVVTRIGAGQGYRTAVRRRIGAYHIEITCVGVSDRISGIKSCRRITGSHAGDGRTGNGKIPRLAVVHRRERHSGTFRHVCSGRSVVLRRPNESKRLRRNRTFSGKRLGQQRSIVVCKGVVSIGDRHADRLIYADVLIGKGRVGNTEVAYAVTDSKIVKGDRTRNDVRSVVHLGSHGIHRDLARDDGKGTGRIGSDHVVIAYIAHRDGCGIRLHAGTVLNVNGSIIGATRNA